MTARSVFGHGWRVVRHFATTRGVEVLALQASPVIGCALGGIDPRRDDMTGVALLLGGSLAMTAHVFVFNDWANYHSDQQDPRREGGGIGRRDSANLAIILLVIAAVALGLVSGFALALGAAIAALSMMYSCSLVLAKNMPVAASLNHLLGGSLHFLLGYTFAHGVDAKGIVVSLFFGLVFAAGHLNQEIRDHDADRLNNIRTSAVTFGSRNTFFASLTLFSAAYALVFGLAAHGVLSPLLLLSLLAWIAQLWWAREALRRGLTFQTALWLQRRYRLLFALIGLGLLMPR